jgi:NAD(P)-dependent dehydrogenase (short-subunit alcohol dehydrogenase family)
MPQDDWDAVLATNLTGAFHCTRRALSSMLAARWGRIVNVSSVVAERANPGQANYAASKAGLLALTRTVAREMARRGITCNAVTPGLVDTDMTAGLVEEMAGAVPCGRPGRPEEVAAAVAFLCSEEAAYVNGATLAVDGALAA